MDFARNHPLDAVVGVDEETTVVASEISAALGLPHNPVEAVTAARNKAHLRAALARSGVRSPRHWLFHRTDDPRSASRTVTYPCVLKPTILSASRGVIRANDPEELVRAWRRIEEILSAPDVREKADPAASEILVEEFVPGDEVAVEGLLQEGVLTVLALFDKPDPLEGPFFEETIYVTPSRITPDLSGRSPTSPRPAAGPSGSSKVRFTPSCAATRSGRRPVESRPARSADSARGPFASGAGLSLEELILRHALGDRIRGRLRARGPAAGVMMIPIPSAGMLEEVAGTEEARRCRASRRSRFPRTSGPAARPAAGRLAVPGVPLQPRGFSRRAEDALRKRTATSASGSARGKGEELLGGGVVGISAGGVVRRVEDLADTRNERPDRLLDPLLERDVGRAAPLATPAQAQEHVVLFDVDELDQAPVLRRRRG